MSQAEGRSTSFLRSQEEEELMRETEEKQPEREEEPSTETAMEAEILSVPNTLSIYRSWNKFMN